MNAEILTVGTELLLGDILNSNSQFLSRELAVYGIDTLYQSTVGDNRERLKNALSLALSRCDMVILTGGLGPTEDDLTRETVAEVLNLPLVLHEESDTRIREYFESTGKEYTDNNRKQAMLPEGCTVFPNEHGTAPGCAVESDGHHVILLPGPPKELVPMFLASVAPYLGQFSDQTIRSHTVGVFGVPEAVVDDRLRDLMLGENPTVAPYAKDGEVQLRVTAKAATEAEADELCRPALEAIRERLGAAVYGVDTGNLAKTVVEMLKERNKKIATAESCTAGLLSGRLTEVPGVSQVFECGIAAYSPEIKRQVLGVPDTLLDAQGTVCPEVAGAMATGARRVGGADIGIGITGVAGPEPSEGKEVGTVYVALADERRVWVKRIFAGGEVKDREQIRNAATLYALDMTRRYMEAYPGVMAGGQPLSKMHKAAVAAPKPTESTMRGHRWIWLSLVLVLLVAAFVVVYSAFLKPLSNKVINKDLNEIYSLGMDWPGLQDVEPGSVKYPDGMLSKFTGLYSINSDVRGWLVLSGAEEGLPVVVNPSEGYYNGRNFFEETSVFGTLHLEKGTTITSTAPNRSLVIYGNNTKSGQMFSELAGYTELTYLKEHSTVQFSTLYHENDYKIFAVVLVQDGDESEDAFDFTVDKFDDEEAFLEYVAQLRLRSLFDTPVDIQEGDDLLLLTTPIEYSFSDARIVVAARRVRTNEEKENDLSKARINKSVLMPSIWQDIQNSATTAETTTTATDNTNGTGKTTSTTQKATTTKKPTQTTLNEEPDSLVGETTATGSTTTSSRPTVTRPPSSGEDETPVTPPAGTVQGTVSEYEIMSYFVLKNSTNTTNDLKGEDGCVRPTTKEELQRLVAQLVKSELGSASTMVKSTEAQKAQAVASYTYVLWYNVAYGKPYACSLKGLDIKNSVNDKKIYDAVGEVLGVKLLDLSKKTIEQQFCSTSYFAASGGYTASSNKVWTGTLAHAQSVVSKYDNASSYAKYGGSGKFEQTVTFTREELYDEVRAWMNDNVLKSHPNYVIPEEQFTTDTAIAPLKALSYDGDGTAGSGDAWNFVFHTNFYYVDARGNKKPLTGYNIRQALGLRSHAFRVSYDAATDTVSITTQGWGHGVGLSQMGAVGYANEEGWNYVQILRHYYSVTDKSGHQVVTPVW